ncbi:MAG: hypothetical protein ACP5VE_00505 [Chthonomonadales bacterium]
MPPILEPVCILTAVREELRPVCRRMRDVQWDAISAPNPDAASRQPPLRCCVGTLAGVAAVATRTGMGVRRAGQAAQHLIRWCQPRYLIVAGFASGLRSGLAPGTVVIASEVLWSPGGREGEQAGRHGLLERAQPHPILLDAAQRILAAHPVEVGGLLTLDYLLLDPSAKATAARLAPSAIAADMETAGGVVAALEAGIPWIALRCITDGASDRLPLRFDRYLGADGEVAPAKLLGAVLREPSSVPGLVRLGARSLRAAGKLAAFVEAFLQTLRGRE